MLQSVLAECFHLTMYRVEKTMPVFALVAAKSGLKLQAAAGSGGPERHEARVNKLRHLVCHGVILRCRNVVGA
jgi:uncharacterized protein (TIGR03435 family)